jgi:ABC-type enterochelin transport system permease subunit
LQMTKKQTAFSLVFFLVFLPLGIGYGGYRTVVDLPRQTDIYPRWSRLMCFIVAGVGWGIGVCGMIYQYVISRKHRDG